MSCAGTHAIAVALFAILRPGDELLCVTGHPYDTLEEVIGSRGEPGIGSLHDKQVTYRVLDLAANGRPDFEGLAVSIQKGALAPA